MKAVRRAAAPIEPCRLRGLQQAVRADDVGHHERIRTGDRAIDMALGGEMDDRVDRMIGNDAADQLGIADVADDELDLGDVIEVGAIARIGERIEHHDLVVRRDAAPVMHEVRPNKTRAARDDQICHASAFAFPSDRRRRALRQP